MLTLAIVAFVAMSTTFLLPPPGLYLPKVQKTSDNSIVVTERYDDGASRGGLTHAGMGMSSFMETYTERNLNVNRPALNETSLDPEFYLLYA